MRSPGAAFDLRAALTQELNAAMEELESRESGPNALHQCRLRLKRARALGRLGQAVAPGLAAVFNDTARAVMHQLGQARELAALADVARKLADNTDGKNAAALSAIASVLHSQHDRAPPLDLESVRAGIRDLIALAQVWPAPSFTADPHRALRAFANVRGAHVSMAAAPKRRSAGMSGVNANRTGSLPRPFSVAPGQPNAGANQPTP